MTDPTTKAIRGTGPRREQRRAACRDFLSKWRIDCWLKNHGDEVWGPEVLLPDKVLTKLAATASLQTKEDIRNEVEGWWLWETYSQEVLDGLKSIDTRFEETKAAKEAERLEQQRIEKDRRTAIAHAEKQRALEEKERKRNIREEEKRQKEEAKRQQREVKEKAKRQKEEAQLQKRAAKEEAKRQKEESKQREEEAKQQRKEAKRRREESFESEVGSQDQSNRREGKRQCVDRASFNPISSSFLAPDALTQCDPPNCPRPRPRPTRRVPPTVDGVENVLVSPQLTHPQPMPPSFPPVTGFYFSAGGMERAGLRPP